MNEARKMKPFRGAMPNRTHPLLRGLRALWIFNEGMGDRVHDFYGNHGTLTNMNPPTDWIAGEHGWTVELDGSDDFIALDSEIVIDENSSLMFRFVKLGGNDDLGGKRSDSKNFFGVWGSSIMAVRDDDNVHKNFDIPTLVNGDWYDVILTKDSSSYWHVYLNGQESSTGGYYGTAPLLFDTIGKGEAAGYNWQGVIDTVGIWNRALMEEEAKWLHRSPFCIFEEPTPRASFTLPSVFYRYGTYILKLSVEEYIRGALTTAGWSDTDKWVKFGRIQPETRPPAIAIDCPEIHRLTYESGGEKRILRGYFDIEVKANSKAQVEDLKDTIEKSVDNMPIIDFNIAMPADPGYDAEAQEIARGLVRETIRGRVVDPIDNTARVSFTLTTDKPI